MEHFIQNLLDWLVYIPCVLLLIAGIIVIKDLVTRKCKDKDNQTALNTLINDNKAIKNYFKVKGVDDFIFDVNRYASKGAISIQDRARLISRYEALHALGANGERDEAYRILLSIKPKD